MSTGKHNPAFSFPEFVFDPSAMEFIETNVDHYYQDTTKQIVHAVRESLKSISTNPLLRIGFSFKMVNFFRELHPMEEYIIAKKHLKSIIAIACVHGIIEVTTADFEEYDIAQKLLNDVIVMNVGKHYDCKEGKVLFSTFVWEIRELIDRLAPIAKFRIRTTTKEILLSIVSKEPDSKMVVTFIITKPD